MAVTSAATQQPGYKYVQPGTYQGLQPAAAQKSDFFKANSYQNPYLDFIQQNQGKANQFLNTPNPLAGITDLASLQAKFGYRKLNPNDPDIPAWMSNLQGGIRNAVDQNALRTANAGVAAGRAGMGVQGGVDTRTAMAMQGNRDIAGMYPELYSRAVDWTKQGIDQSNLAANAYMGAASDVYRSQLGAGTTLMNQVLNAIQSGDASQMQWALQMINAFNSDVDTTNALRQNERNYAWQEADRRRQQQEAGIAQQQAFEQDQLRRRLTQGTNYNIGQYGQVGNWLGDLAYAQATGAMPIGKIGGYKEGMPAAGGLVSGAGSGLSGYNMKLDQSMKPAGWMESLIR